MIRSGTAIIQSEPYNDYYTIQRSPLLYNDFLEIVNRVVQMRPNHSIQALRTKEKRRFQADIIAQNRPYSVIFSIFSPFLVAISAITFRCISCKAPNRESFQFFLCSISFGFQWKKSDPNSWYLLLHRRQPF